MHFLLKKRSRLFRKRVALDKGGGVGGNADIADKGGKGVGEMLTLAAEIGRGCWGNDDNG